MRDYKEDIVINIDDLEAEWIEQPSLMMHYSELLAHAQKDRDRAKAKLDFVHAKLDAEVRSRWEKHFDSKPTEPALKNYIITLKRYREAQKELIKVTEEVNLLSGVRTSFDHRKRALENLVSLKISGFHSEPRNKKFEQKGDHTTQTTALNEKRTGVTSRKRKKKRS